MTTPIPDLPETPLPSQNQDDFNALAEAFLLALGPWADAANVLGDEMESLADGSSDDAEAAAASAEAAALSAESIVDYNGTSDSELTIGAGSHELTVDVGKRWVAGTDIKIIDTANVNNAMWGIVVTYDDETGDMEFYCNDFIGSGTITAWRLTLSGPRAQANLFIQDSAPAASQGPCLWLDTSGTYLALYFEDGT